MIYITKQEGLGGLGTVGFVDLKNIDHNANVQLVLLSLKHVTRCLSTQYPDT